MYFDFNTKLSMPTTVNQKKSFFEQIESWKETSSNHINKLGQFLGAETKLLGVTNSENPRLDLRPLYYSSESR